MKCFFKKYFPKEGFNLIIEFKKTWSSLSDEKFSFFITILLNIQSNNYRNVKDYLNNANYFINFSSRKESVFAFLIKGKEHATDSQNNKIKDYFDLLYYFVSNFAEFNKNNHIVEIKILYNEFIQKNVNINDNTNEIIKLLKDLFCKITNTNFSEFKYLENSNIISGIQIDKLFDFYSNNKQTTKENITLSFWFKFLCAEEFKTKLSDFWNKVENASFFNRDFSKLLYFYILLKSECFFEDMCKFDELTFVEYLLNKYKEVNNTEDINNYADITLISKILKTEGNTILEIIMNYLSKNRKIFSSLLTTIKPKLNTQELVIKKILQDESQKFLNFQEILIMIAGVKFEFIFVKAGNFNMSNPQNEHKVTLIDDYYIGKFQVTQEQWTAVMQNNPSYFRRDNLPVEKVSWNDCQQFIQKLNDLVQAEYIKISKSNMKFRLPTEAEWEYAAHGGNQSNGYIYSGSNNIDEVSWFKDNSNNRTHPVGQKKPNELGIYDMSGNVWEWCQDWYDGSATNPRGANNSSGYVLRGGGWDSAAVRCRVDFLHALSAPSCSSNDFGFRLVMIY